MGRFLLSVACDAAFAGFGDGEPAELIDLPRRFHSDSCRHAGPQIDAAMLEGLNQAKVVVMVTTLAGLIVLLPFVRRLIALLIPIDSSSRVHAAALSLSALIFAYLMATVAIGLDNIAKWNEAAPRSTAGTVSSIWAQDILLTLLALVGVGWLARRRFGDALQRLGIVKPSFRQLGLGVGIGLAMVVVAQVVEQLLYAAGIPLDPHVEKVTEQVIGPLFSSVPGILTLGMAAALGKKASSAAPCNHDSGFFSLPFCSRLSTVIMVCPSLR